MSSRSSFTLPNAITGFRLVLFFLFVFFLFQERISIAGWCFFGAWALDVVDGAVARALHQESALGSFLDKIVDRIILGFSVLVLIRTEYIPPASLLILTKDFSLLPMLTVHAARGESLQSAGWMGKGMMGLQGAGVLWQLLSFPYGDAVISVVAVLGGVVGFFHIRRYSFAA